jgi:hypothetical protein
MQCATAPARPVTWPAMAQTQQAPVEGPWPTVCTGCPLNPPHHPDPSHHLCRDWSTHHGGELQAKSVTAAAMTVMRFGQSLLEAGLPRHVAMVSQWLVGRLQGHKRGALRL